MGAWKNILIMHEEGNKQATKTIAIHYESRGDYRMARYYYSHIGDSKSVERIDNILQGDCNVQMDPNTKYLH